MPLPSDMKNYADDRAEIDEALIKAMLGCIGLALAGCAGIAAIMILNLA